MEAFIIGLGGGSASGKTTVAKKIIESLKVDWVSLVSMDSFYKVLDEEQHALANQNNYDFDHPGELHMCYVYYRNLGNFHSQNIHKTFFRPFYFRTALYVN